MNRTLKIMIASYVGDQHKQWDKYLPEFQFAINSATQESTGVSPAEPNLGRPLRGPLDVVQQPWKTSPETTHYTHITQLEDLRSFVSRNLDAEKEL